MEKRKIDIAVISDTHLGTFGSRAKEVVQYLRSIEPRMLILNGDIVDFWQFNKYYFPDEHTIALQEMLDMAKRGIPVFHLTGNHDDLLRRYTEFSFGNFHLVDSMLLEVDGKTCWIFHGDAFDKSVSGFARTMAVFGGWCYDWSVFWNRQLNKVLRSIGLKPVFISKAIKDTVKGFIKKMNDWETKALEFGIENGYDYVICGHVHRPTIQHHKTENGEIMYLNSGDWMENMTALEYYGGKWRMFRYREAGFPADEELELVDMSPEELEQHTLAPKVKVVMENGVLLPFEYPSKPAAPKL